MSKIVAILSPGDMGGGVGRVLVESGRDVITSLSGRSLRTKRLAKEAGILDVSSLEDVVSSASLVLSILVPSEAESLAHNVAESIKKVRAKTVFIDCNAVSPATSIRMGAEISGAGGRYIDASIIGTPPGKGDPPRFYTSGIHAELMDELDGLGIVVRRINADIGAASAIKMCYAGFTKGTSALSIGILMMAEFLGVAKELSNEMSESQPAGLQRMKEEIPGLPVKARRWVGEMEEIAATFRSPALPSGFHEAAADIYSLVGKTPFAEETPEDLDRSRGLWETISAIPHQSQ